MISSENKNKNCGERNKKWDCTLNIVIKLIVFSVISFFEKLDRILLNQKNLLL